MKEYKIFQMRPDRFVPADTVKDKEAMTALRKFLEAPEHETKGLRQILVKEIELADYAVCDVQSGQFTYYYVR